MKKSLTVLIDLAKERSENVWVLVPDPMDPSGLYRGGRYPLSRSEASPALPPWFNSDMHVAHQLIFMRITRRPSNFVVQSACGERL